MDLPNPPALPAITAVVVSSSSSSSLLGLFLLPSLSFSALRAQPSWSLSLSFVPSVVVHTTAFGTNIAALGGRMTTGPRHDLLLLLPGPSGWPCSRWICFPSGVLSTSFSLSLGCVPRTVVRGPRSWSWWIVGCFRQAPTRRTSIAVPTADTRKPASSTLLSGWSRRQSKSVRSHAPNSKLQTQNQKPSAENQIAVKPKPKTKKQKESLSVIVIMRIVIFTCCNDLVNSPPFVCECSRMKRKRCLYWVE